jgi:hypothetical protein
MNRGKQLHSAIVGTLIQDYQLAVLTTLAKNAEQGQPKKWARIVGGEAYG